MEADNEASRTAMMVAAYRARATARANAICNDPWAEALAGPEGAALAQRFDALFRHMELWMALRTAYLDRQVRDYTGAAHDYRQVVILGAGLDTRAVRLARAGVRFFEVDHPATQAHKRERVATLDAYDASAATYVPCCFETGDDFLDALTAAGFDASAPAVVLWEGVVPYLTEDAVRETAARIADGFHPRTLLFFDFIGKRMVQGADLRTKDHGTRDYVDDLGEPLRFGTNDILPLLYDCGFRWVRKLSFDEICLAYTGTYDRTYEFRFQSLVAATRGRDHAPSL